MAYNLAWWHKKGAFMYGLSPIAFGAVSAVTASRGPNDPAVGDVRHEGANQYRYVFNAGASTLSSGKGAILSAVSGYSVTVSSTTSVDLLVGVAVNSIAASAYGYILEKGFGQVQMGADYSAAAGALLILAADGTFTNKTISTGFVSPGLVKAMSAIASGASGTAYISVL
jgi:hypothetical protein